MTRSEISFKYVVIKRVGDTPPVGCQMTHSSSSSANIGWGGSRRLPQTLLLWHRVHLLMVNDMTLNTALHEYDTFVIQFNWMTLIDRVTLIYDSRFFFREIWNTTDGSLAESIRMTTEEWFVRNVLSH